MINSAEKYTHAEEIYSLSFTFLCFHSQQTEMDITRLESGLDNGGNHVKEGKKGSIAVVEQEVTSDQEEGTVNSKMLKTKPGSSLSPEQLEGPGSRKNSKISLAESSGSRKNSKTLTVPEGSGSRKNSKTPAPDNRRPSRQLRLDSESPLVDNMDEEDDDDEGTGMNASFETAKLEDGLRRNLIEEDAFEDVSLGDDEKVPGSDVNIGAKYEMLGLNTKIEGK